MKLLAPMLLMSVLSMPALAADELVISGRVVDTASPARDDTPLASVLVEILAPDGTPLRETSTNRDGRFHFAFDKKDKLTGKETIRVDAAGYSAKPTLQQIKLERPKGMNLAYQGEFLLTNDKRMREEPAYRTAVAESAVRGQTEVGQKERASKILASIVALPKESKEVAFASVRALSVPAFSELTKVDKEVAGARELESALRIRGSQIIPLYEPGGTIRLTGSAKSQNEMDTILLEAGQKGFKGKAVINDMQVRNRLAGK